MSERTCKVCGKGEGDLKRCAKCKRIFYCSRKCQVDDWPTHKSVCALPPLITTSPTVIPLSNPNENTIPEVIQNLNINSHFKQQPNFANYYKKPIDKTTIPTDFSNFHYLPTKDEIFTNLLIILHGLGDTLDNFKSFGAKLSIPQCSILTLQAPDILPFECGYSWYPIFEENGEMIRPTKKETRRLFGLQKSRKAIVKLISRLINDFGYSAENIFLFGYSQGGVVCVDFLLNYMAEKELEKITSFGGCVAIADSVIEEYLLLYGNNVLNRNNNSELVDQNFPFLLRNQNNNLSTELTPLFLSVGEKDDRISINQSHQKHQFLLSIYSIYQSENRIKFFQFPKGHQMINSQEEAKEMHKFFSDNMILRTPSLDSLSEVYQYDNNNNNNNDNST